MNSLDIARIVIDRLWKPALVTLIVLSALVASIIGFGFGGTVGLLLFAAIFAAFYYKGNEIYFFGVKCYYLVSDKVNSYMTPIIEDIKNEIKAVTAAHVALRAAKAARKDAKAAVKSTRKAVKSNAKIAAKALKVQLIAAGNGETVNELVVATLNARKDADQAVADARSALVALDSANKAVEIAEEDYRNASQTYRDSKSEEPVTTA